MTWAQKLWQRGQNLFPTDGFHFDRPLVLLQSDDWGRVGLRDQEGLEQLRSAGVALGEQPYDFYTLETAEDLTALQAMLNRHRDAHGRSACMGMNFIVANLDFAKMHADGFHEIYLQPLADGLPDGWVRPGLFEAYREGIRDGVFSPAMHGSTHFCWEAVVPQLQNDGERNDLLRKFWRAGTPYIHWRMPWIGYEYWQPEKSADERFLSTDKQRELIGSSVGMFVKLFGALPRSACAPGYRSNGDTHRAWSEYGIRVAQNGPGTHTPPHMDRNGILNLYRSVEFEPATDLNFTVEACVRVAEDCFARGLPAVVSIHSINFHSSVKDFRSRTLKLLDEFLSTLQSRHSDLLYLHDEDMHGLVSGAFETAQGRVRVNVAKKRFMKSRSMTAPVQQ